MERMLNTNNILDYLKSIENSVYEMTTYTDITSEDSMLLLACIQKIRKNYPCPDCYGTGHVKTNIK